MDPQDFQFRPDRVLDALNQEVMPLVVSEEAKRL